MLVICDDCGYGFQVDKQLGGRIARCKCGERLPIPIHDPARLLDWAFNASFRRLRHFVNMGGAKGHKGSIVDQLIEMVIDKRNAIIEQNELLEAARVAAVESQKRINASKRHHEKVSQLFRKNQRIEQLLHLSPKAFENLIAEAFRAEGYDAAPVGGTRDGGIDVIVSGSDGKSNYAIAQCKRFHPSIAVGSPAIQRVAGAYLHSNTNLGFFFTTSRFSTYARDVAAKFGWLELYDGERLVDWLRAIADGVRGHLQHQCGMIEPYRQPPPRNLS